MSIQDGLSKDQIDDIAAVLGRTPSGIFILTATDGDRQETGMMASWVQQASFAPPAVTVAVNKQRYIGEWLRKSQRAAVSLLGDSNKTMLKHFSKGFEPGEDAFEGLTTSRSANDLPVLDDALGHLAGEITGEVDAGDHVVYVLTITSAARGEKLAEESPRVHIRKNGLAY